MLSNSDRDILFSLNHLSRELLQIMLHAKMKLEENAFSGEEDKLINSIDYTFETIRRQTENVDDFLKRDAANKAINHTVVNLLGTKGKKS